MAKFRKKPVVIEAQQWFKNGDHPADNRETFVDAATGEPFLGEGKVVRYYRHPAVDGLTVCNQCEAVMHSHGWIDTLEGGHIVCVGDWVITGIAGERYPCKPAIFEATYEPVLEDSVAEAQLRLWYGGKAPQDEQDETS
jgi:hypothetical protein